MLENDKLLGIRSTSWITCVIPVTPFVHTATWKPVWCDVCINLVNSAKCNWLKQTQGMCCSHYPAYN